MIPCTQKLCLLVAALALGACGDSESPVPLYEDVTELSGLAFEHQNGSNASLALPSIMGSGVALFDVDNDADLDVYLVQGKAGADSPDEIWRNDTEGGRLRFTRIDDEPALVSESPGMGVAISDANQDGRLDVLVTTLGVNRLLLNTEQGFVPSASNELRAAGVWSASAVWFDANADQRPDLYIANVAEFDAKITCRSDTSRPDYCGVNAYVPLPDQLLLNFGATDDGDVVFEDASQGWNLADVKRASLGVRSGDFNRDNRPDIYVTTFETDNALWVNRRGRRFEERARISGVASDFRGLRRSSISADAADLDGDNDLDLVVSHDRGEPHQIYLNDGFGNFLADALRVRGASESHSGTGLVVLDADADGLQDIFVANGALRQRQTQLDASDALPLRQSNALFLRRLQSGLQSDSQSRPASESNETADGDLKTAMAVTPPAHDEVVTPVTESVLRFEEWKQIAERLTPRPQVSRSVATGDLDNDGDLDLVVTNNGGRAQVLRSTADPEDWIGINPVSSTTGTTITGTLARIVQPEVAGVRDVRRSHGYLSASDPRLIFYGLLEGGDNITVSLTWPGGKTERFTLAPESRYHTLVQGQGEP